MSDSERKVFPVESVLALIVGKEDVDTKAIAGFITGHSIQCDVCGRAVGPFAAAWLARLYPKFMDMEFKEGQSWQDFLTQGRAALGDNVSIPAMDAPSKALVEKTLAYLEECHNSVVTQTNAAMQMEAKVHELEPAVARADELQKQVDKLEETIKTMKTDMGGLRKQVAEFQGKVAINHDELMQSIKDAIKDGMKGMVVAGTAAAGAAGASDAAAAEEPAAEEDSVPDDFGFGFSGADNDGFGF